MNISNNTTLGNSNGDYAYQKQELNLLYATCEIIVAILAVVGNSLVIFVFLRERRLRRRTNYYIVSLAAADLLVGLLGIPFAVLSSIGRPINLYACLFTVSLLIVLCTISIFCLVAVSVDRYWAILHPMGYSRNVRTRTALVIISVCWFAGSFVGFLPLLGWRNSAAKEKEQCFFLNVMDLNYLVFLYFGTIITPALLLIAFYAHIYQVVVKQLRQIVTMNPEKGSSTKGYTSGSTMIRMLGVQQTNEVKATQNLAIIVLFFMICWIPLYTINCILAFRPKFHVNPTFMLCCIILSHMNSAGNPLLYAYHLRDFRAALKNFFCQLFDRRQCCDHLNKSNYGHYRFQMRKKSSTASLCHLTNTNKVKIIGTENITSIARTSAAIATVVSGDTNRRTIWNISENSSGSSDSNKSGPCEKALMIRPATPYRPRNVSEINSAYAASNFEADSEDDDDFQDEPLPYRDCSVMDTSLSDQIKKTDLYSTFCHHRKKSLSNSSPQLSKGLFFVENETQTVICDTRLPHTPIVVNSTTDLSLKFTPLKVIDVFKEKKPLSRSLSDSGNVCLKCSVNVNGVLSCGS